MKKSSKIVIIVLIIIVTFSLGTVGGYLLFKNKYDGIKNNTEINDTNKNNSLDKNTDSNNNNNSNPNNNKNNNSNSNNTSGNTIKEESLSLTDSTVTKLFDRKTNFHTTSKVTYNTLNDQWKLSADLNGLTRKSFSNLSYKDVCAKLKNSGSASLSSAYNECINMGGKNASSGDLVGYYDLEEVRNNNIKFFNESSNLPKKYSYVNSTSLKTDDSCGQVVLSNNTYLSYDSSCGYGGLDSLTKKTLVKAVKYGDELYIYDKFIVGVAGSSQNDYVSYDFYSDDDLTNKVTTYSFKETDDGNYSIEVNDILKYMKSFKHTYKLNSNGNYYWVSSEPVNSIN